MKLTHLMSKVLVFLFLVTLGIIPNQVGLAQEENPNMSMIYDQSNYQNPFVPGQVIVVFKEGYENSVHTVSAFSGIDINSVEELTTPMQLQDTVTTSASLKNKIVLLKLKDSSQQGVLEAIDKLKSNSYIKYAEPDYELKTDNTVPNDPDFSKLYGMNKISAPQAWDKTTGNSSVVVGVIDTGIDYNHPDLKDNMWKNPGEIPNNGIDDDKNGYIDDIYGWDFVNNDNNPMDDHYHGTHCAGTIAGVGNNGIGVAGVTWKAKLVALKFLDNNGSGYTSNAIKAVDYANKMGFPITSNSWGGGGYSQALRDVIAAGGLFVAAAGNRGTNNDSSPFYPASYDCNNIISVAATDSNDNLASFSCYGVNSVDIAAPGVSIWSCRPGNSYQYLSGTSMATPHVSGAAALLKAYNLNLSTQELKANILNGVDKLAQLSDKTASGGRLNVYKTLSNVVKAKYSFNGDGKDDIAALYDYGNGATRIHTFLSTGSLFQYQGSDGWWRCDSGYTASDVTRRVVSGDYNGDGKNDIATLYDYTNGATRIHVWLSTGSSFQYQGADGWWRCDSGYTASNVTGRVVSGDYNGDGKSDIATLYDYGNGATRIHVWLSTGSSFQYQGADGWWRCDSGYTASNVTGRVVSGDYNGDGKSDIATLYDYGNGATRIHVWVSTGSSFQYQGADGWWRCDSGYTASNVTGRVVSGDYNGDGKSDIATLYDYGNSATRIHTWLSTGSSFQYQGADGWWRCDSGYTANQVTGRVVP
ncbi:MAG: S8 family serine peptidase [Bacillota bacterium]